jgi:predicted RNase H-like HicB family nuclease
MTDERAFTAVVRREEGLWLADVPDLPGVHTFARTLATLRDHLADAIALWLETQRIDAGERDPHVDRGSVDLHLDVKLPRSISRAAAASRQRRERAAQADREAAAATQTAVEQLTEIGVSHRDAAELLDLSHQRVGQLARQRR